MTRKEWIPYGIVFIALFVGAIYDYQISNALYHSTSLFGIIFERVILLPIQFVVVFTLCLLYRKYKFILFLFIAIFANYYILSHALAYWVSTNTILMHGIMGVLAIGITLLLSLWLQRVEDNWVNAHIAFFLFFTLVLLTATLMTTLLKEVWGRIRFRDMKDASQFCVWYKPCGFTGNRSFPSGHTCAMSAILCLLQWRTNHYQKPSSLLYIFVGGMILAMAFSRIVMGAHFLSDTAAGFLICYSCYLLYRLLFQRRKIL